MIELPNNLKAEESFLGSLILDASKLCKARAAVAPEMFYRDGHRAIYEAILNLGDAADIVTVTDRLQQMGKLETAGGAPYVVALPNATPTPENWEHYADIIRRTHVQRTIILLGKKAETLARDDPERALAEITVGVREIRRFASPERKPVPVEDILPRVFDEMQRASELPPGEVPGVPYGFPDIDEATGGQQPGEIVVITAPTGRGKSALVGRMWVTAGQRRGPALMCSNEMPGVQYGQRLLAAEANVDTVRLRNPRLLSDADETRLSRAMGVLAEPKRRLFLQEGVFTPEHVRSSIEAVLEETGGITWVCVDYLQRMRSGRRRDNKVQEIDDVMDALCEIAMEYAVPVVVTAQYDKYSAQSGLIGVEAARGSGGIGYAAHTAIAVVDDETDDGAVRRRGRLVVTKSRSGPRVTQDVVFLGPFVKFVPMETTHDEGAQT
ncbi:MAG TPA: replicative DNA helicase [bacterium]|nr:replicative DNA helicase [bacterium]